MVLLVFKNKAFKLLYFHVSLVLFACSNTLYVLFTLQQNKRMEERIFSHREITFDCSTLLAYFHIFTYIPHIIHLFNNVCPRL